jgi:hypothetical protein
MSVAILQKTQRRTARFVSNTGHLRNEHFFMSADHMMLEVDQSTFELVSAHAEGNIQLHMLCPEGNQDYTAFGQSAIYQPERSRITLSGWTGARHNGQDYPPAGSRNNVVIPTDGSFFNGEDFEQSDDLAA